MENKFNKKKVWILNHHAQTPSTGSGTRHYDFAQELRHRGYDVTVFASSHMHYTTKNLLSDGEEYKITDEDGLRWVWINTRSYTSNGIQRILGMYEYYRKVLKIRKGLEQPDYIIGSAVHLLACVAAYKIAKENKIKCICEIRDLWPETLIQMGKMKRNSLLARAMNMLEDFVYKKSDKIIITAPGMREYIASRGISEKKIVYINNGLHTASFDSRLVENYEDDKKGKLDKQYFNVVYTGAHGLANDLETALKAAKNIQDRAYENIIISFFGDGPLKKDLIKKAGEMGLKNVVFRE